MKLYISIIWLALASEYAVTSWGNISEEIKYASQDRIIPFMWIIIFSCQIISNVGQHLIHVSIYCTFPLACINLLSCPTASSHGITFYQLLLLRESQISLISPVDTKHILAYRENCVHLNFREVEEQETIFVFNNTHFSAFSV